jgi:hypothetical protein
MWKYRPPKNRGRASMRWLALILTYLFLIGLVGSGLVILVTFWSDLEAFTPDDGPTVADPSDRAQTIARLKSLKDSHGE